MRNPFAEPGSSTRMVVSSGSRGTRFAAGTKLGEFRLRDPADPELMYQLTHESLPADFRRAARSPSAAGICRCR
jgi:hypothetical protein